MTDLLDQVNELDDGMADDGPANIYPGVFAVVSEFLAALYARKVHDERHSFRWCSQWGNHIEAVTRLEAVWKAWEVLRLDPGT